MDSTLFIIPVLLIFCIYLLKVVASNRSSTRKVFKDNIYNYTAKPSLMSPTEGEFFVKLEKAVNERYYVFPQVHLSALLDHKVKGQEWKYAFSHINGKSVDYVLCDKETLRPSYAIELDDYTHDHEDRKTRDIEVERMFKVAGLPLVRFRDKDVTSDEIIQTLAATRVESKT